MRLIGYCERCHKIKSVTVRGGLTTKSVPWGICRDCEEKERERAQTRAR